METNTVVRAEQYYKLVGEKNVKGIEKYLDPEVEFCSPFATLKGKEAVINATGNFMHSFKSLGT